MILHFKKLMHKEVSEWPRVMLLVSCRAKIQTLFHGDAEPENRG
jgi:hypothetical protein